METMTTGRFPFSGGSVGNFVNQISPRCGLGMRQFLLAQNKIASGELSPGSLLFNFFVGQAVIVGDDICLKLSESLFARLFQ